MLGFVYMFGGRTTGQNCDFAITESCQYFTSVTNLVWRLDPLTYTWYGCGVGALVACVTRLSKCNTLVTVLLLSRLRCTLWLPLWVCST